MGLVDSMYYPTMPLCLENSPLIRIWVKCVSARANPGEWRSGAILAHTNGSSAHNGVAPRGGLNHSRGGCSPGFGVCMNRKFLSLCRTEFLDERLILGQIRFTASKPNFCGLYILKRCNMKELLLYLSLSLCLFVLQCSLWRKVTPKILY